MNNLDSNGRYRNHHEASSDYVHHLFSKKLEESTPASKEKDASDKLLETVAEAVEIRKMLSKQLQSFSPSTSSFLGQLPDTVGLTMSSLLSGIKTAAAAPNLVNYIYALQFYNILINNKMLDFEVIFVIIALNAGLT